MNIYDMAPGECYLVGDGLGYDKVRCIGKKFDNRYNANVVEVEYLETGSRDIYFETAGYGFSIYVEPLVA
jgi:hypothetical protein